jgi:uncharacterized repeat protein (TIGR01451 family)
MIRVSRVWPVALMFLAGLGLCSSPAQAQVCTQLNAGAISGLVWFDANGNGVRDASELTGGIAGVQVQLLDSAGTVLRTTTTGTGVGSILGFYAFNFLCAGTYTVRVVEPTVPAGYVPTLEGASSDPSRGSVTSPVTGTIVWDPVNERFSKWFFVDFGYKAGCAASLGDFVWEDRNRDGVQDADEPGLAGVSVQLYAGATQQATTTTNGSGAYTFAGLCPGTYSVRVTTPEGMTPSPVDGTPDISIDSDASGVLATLDAAEHDPTYDFGFYTPCTGVIGDRVWLDTNRNGVQDDGELGISNVTVELLQDGTVIRSAVTDADGLYGFGSLCPGTYGVRVKADTLPVGVTASPTGAGGDATRDSNVQPSTVVLSSYNSTDTTIDFGYNTPCSGKIGDFVWNDANRNGVQDAGELGIPNVMVSLIQDGTTLSVDTTDASGLYTFAGLCSGEYVVEVNPSTLPGSAGWLASPPNAGSNDAADSDGIEDRASVSLPSDFGQDLTIDFGYDRDADIQIVKTTNGTNNDQAPGVNVAPGSAVTWTYSVTATGSTEPIADVALIDDNGTASTTDDITPAYQSGDDGDGLLEAGEAWVYTATGTAIAGQYENWATVTGTGKYSGTPVSDKDVDHYYGKEPAKPVLKIVKTGNGPLPIGALARFTITVTNLGPGSAKNVVITDPLPAGLAWTESSICTISSATLTCNVGTLSEGQVFTVVVSATLATSAFDSRCFAKQHRDGDGCEHEKRYRGHYRGDRCEHEKTAQHRRGDYCSHDRGWWGHHAGDRCDHDRATTPVECSVVNTASVRATDVPTASSRATIGLSKTTSSHHDGDGCSHERRSWGHYSGDRCEHDTVCRWR